MLQHNTRLSVSMGLTLPTEQIQSHIIKTWRQKTPDLSNQIPAVFAIGR
jgi:hypothetical protein